ncbi:MULTISPECIES: hypothetical protein [unclassified Sphingobium]|uniref:hypothetical protein n=1 Tax=unclassified Sphingobium TaxID=2611147 RepID=UPI002225AEEB|nr:MULTISPECIES: hypothetical protein [unclassified Sphingobium]MCW2412950.1 hypothetical protein [Sphingobium sp. B8D3D]MCW2414752.1 hypothetical protein [Sphingobium sp. B8D3A]
MLNWKSKLKSVAGTQFAPKKYNAVVPRDRFIDNVNAQLHQFRDRSFQTKVKPTFIEKNGEVRFTLRFGTSAINLRGDDDETAYVVQSSEFEEVLNGVLAEARAGAFDVQLNAISAKLSAQLSAARKKKQAV